MDTAMQAHWLSDEEVRALVADEETLNKLSVENSDPVVTYNNGQYYYWDETWSQCFGPFDNEIECRASLTAYAKTI